MVLAEGKIACALFLDYQMMLYDVSLIIFLGVRVRLAQVWHVGCARAVARASALRTSAIPTRFPGANFSRVS